MFHNGGNLSFSCNNMSATSTPHRHPRGVPVPYIDTRASMPKPATALQCGGWLTPPQSAHESRRPSLAYSSYSEMPYSAASTGTGFSLPSTPSRSVPEHQRPAHHSPQSFSQGHVSLDLGVSLNNSHFSQDLIHLNLESQQGCDLGRDASWSAHPVISDGAEDFHDQFDSEHTEPMWQMHNVPDNGFMHQPSGLQATLFPVSHGMTTDHQNMQLTYDSATCSLDDSNIANFPTLQIDTFPVDCYQPPEIVEPALVNPQHEYIDQHYSMHGSSGSSPQDLSASFASGFSSSWEEVNTPGPEVDCCEEVDDWNFVKTEGETSPMSMTEYKPSRTRASARRLSKKAKKVRTVKMPGGIELQLEGDGVEIGEQGFVCNGNSTPSKLFVCNFVDDDGHRCDRSFKRCEHLKRHNSMHNPERRFPCVLPECTKRISRSDNACDHYRTHLQPGGQKNKRNKPFHWKEVKRRIEFAHEQRTAGKIIVNLERWLDKASGNNKLLRQTHADSEYKQDNRPLLRIDIE